VLSTLSSAALTPAVLSVAVAWSPGDYRVSGRGAGTGEPTSAPGTMNGTRPRLPTGRASRLVSGR